MCTSAAQIAAILLALLATAWTFGAAAVMLWVLAPRSAKGSKTASPAAFTQQWGDSIKFDPPLTKSQADLYIDLNRVNHRLRENQTASVFITTKEQLSASSKERDRLYKERVAIMRRLLSPQGLKTLGSLKTPPLT